MAVGRTIGTELELAFCSITHIGLAPLNLLFFPQHFLGPQGMMRRGQGVVWYSGQFWALYFLQQVSKVDALTSAYIVGAALLIATPSLILFGWLSDVIGRKPVILGGMLLAAIRAAVSAKRF
jgi:MFS family permease